MNNNWVSVDERLPPEKELVLFLYWEEYFDFSMRRVGLREGNRYFQLGDTFTVLRTGKVTHWQFLPSRDGLEKPTF